ncbi:MAG: DUF3376 domain-containing protein [Actinobacteria bacterium]|nr:DUF3376 domain-containing protein [Actinomycetota bacterium]
MSLAVWIGGVTREIDAARFAFETDTDDGKDTGPLYRKILETLDETVVVDVIAGASAGGINGVLLAAAIFNGKRVSDLRETWISIGDFRTLLRSPSPPNPRSLMKGDEVVLPRLSDLIATAYEGGSHGPNRPFYLYVTATDLFGFAHDFVDSTGRKFAESDHRRVFRFQHDPDRPKQTIPPDRMNVMRDQVWFRDDDSANLLAHAARSSSSFPVAFEPHHFDIVDHVEGAEQVHSHWLIDGGVLDNQPFNPVLDKIGVLPAEGPVKRVVMYVVPYVTEVGSLKSDAPEEATALDTYSASGSLPRDLPKLESLERITREMSAQNTAEDARKLLRDKLTPDTLKCAAECLFDSYVETRALAADAVWRTWASEDFRPGDGALAQDPSIAPDMMAPPPQPRVSIAAKNAEELEHPPWLPENGVWEKDGGAWKWGLAPAERIAISALAVLRDATSPTNANGALRARRHASHLIAMVRKAKVALQQEFDESLHEKRRHALDADQHARRAYKRISRQLQTIQREFERLDAEIEQLRSTFPEPDMAPRKKGAPPSKPPFPPLGIQSLIDYEVTRNATGIPNEQPSVQFDFVLASAGVSNSLGHAARTPAEKLAGMKLNHFGGFLKRSWRANDWLWGRLDGVEHVMRAVVDVPRLRETAGAKDLATIAHPTADDPDVTALEREALAKRWPEILKQCGLGDLAKRQASFIEVAAIAIDKEKSDKERSRACVRACRSALAARIQLRILDQDLLRIAETARDDVRRGSSRIASGAYWAARLFVADRNLRERSPRALTPQERIDLFCDMHVGNETLQDESSSRLVLDVGSQAVAVAAAMFAGERGGLPTFARGLLASLRGTTLSTSKVVRLIAAEPWVGAAAFAGLVGLVVWAALSKHTLIGALLPALAILTVAAGVALFTIATSVLEQSLTSFPRAAGYLVLIGAPLGFALVAWKPGVHSMSKDLHQHVGHTATGLAVAFALVAAVLALLRLIGTAGVWIWEKIQAKFSKKRQHSRSWRHTVLSLYRWPVLAALLTLAAGFLFQRNFRDDKGGKAWAKLADNHHGIILILALLATLLLAALIQEVLAIWRSRLTSTGARGRLVTRVRGGLGGIDLQTYTAGAVVALSIVFLWFLMFWVGLRVGRG